MKITSVKGSKGETDRIFMVTTRQDEPITIIKLCVLVNYLSQNEYLINKGAIDYTGNFFFSQAVNEAIVLGKAGVNFREWINKKENFDAFCKKYHFKGAVKAKAWIEVCKDIQVELLDGLTKQEV